MAKNIEKKKKRIAHNYASYEKNESLPDDVLSKIFQGMDSTVIPNEIFKSNKTVPQKNERNSTETQANRNCANIIKKFGSNNRKHPLMEKTKLTIKQLKHNRQLPKPRAHLATFSVVDNPPETIIPKRTNKVKEIKQSECKTKKINHELKKRNVPKKPMPSKKSSYPVEESSEVERNNFNRIDDSSDGEYEKFIKKSKKGLKTKPKKANLKRKKSPPPKKVCKKTALYTKSVLTESDSEVDDESSSKPSYKNVKRTKKSQKISYNTRSRISEKDSESEMDVFNVETRHVSTSEDESLPDEPFICDDPFFLEMDMQNSSDKSDVTQLVDNGEFNCLRRTTDITAMGSGPINTLHKIPDVTSSGNQTNEQIDTPTMRTDKINTLHKIPYVTSSYNQTNISANEQIGTPMRTGPTNTLNKMADVTLSCNQTNISANEQIDTIDLTDSDDESENSLPKIVKVSSQNDNNSLSHSEDSEVEMVDVIVHPIKPECNVVNIKNEKVDPIPLCSTTKQYNVDINTKYEAVYATGMCQEPEKDVTKDNIKVPNLNCDIVQSNLKDESTLIKKVKEEPCDDCEIILDSPPANKSSINFPNVPTHKNICIKTENNSEISTTTDNASRDDTLANKKVSNLSQKEQKLHAIACSNFKNLTDTTNKKMEVLEDGKLSELDIKTALKALKEEFATYNEIIQTEQYVENTFKLLEQRQAERLIALKSRISRLLGNTSSSSGECINDAMNEFLDSAVLNTSQSSENCAKLSSEGTNVNTFHPVAEDSKKSITLVPLSTIPEQDIKPNLSNLQAGLNLTAGSSESDKTTSMSFGEKCIVCSKEALAACEQCAKVFYCSNECGKKYWDAGHINTCQALSSQ